MDKFMEFNGNGRAMVAKKRFTKPYRDKNYDLSIGRTPHHSIGV